MCVCMFVLCVSLCVGDPNKTRRDRRRGFRNFFEKKMKRETLTLLIWDQRAVHFMTR